MSQLKSYRTDPVWLQAQAAFIDPGACSADMRLVESMRAAITMWAIERAGGAV
jgi:hypothetical protein